MFEMFKDYNEEGSSGSSSSSSGTAYPPQASGRFVVSISGSALIERKIDTTLIAKICNSINTLHNEGYGFAVTVGGGKTCRDYASAAKILGSSNFDMDEIGIAATRLNARLVIQSLDSANPKVLTSFSRASELVRGNQIPVFGGLLPGYTTDAVAALLAESLNAVFINLTNVDGIYSADPRESKTAKFYETISHERLLSIIMRSASRASSPGQHVVLDIPSALILKRSNIKSMIMLAEDTENFEAAVRGQEFSGTTVITESSGSEEPEEV